MPLRAQHCLRAHQRKQHGEAIVTSLYTLITDIKNSSPQAPALRSGLSHRIAVLIRANTFLLTRQVSHRNFTPDLRCSPPQKHIHCIQAVPCATEALYLPVSWQSSHASTHRSLPQQVSLPSREANSWLYAFSEARNQ